MKDTMRQMIKNRACGIHCGIASYCTANGIVIEAILEQAKRFDGDILLEATANQVNQFGGYTGMLPADYRDFVYKIADRVDFPRERIILGGDHLGPLTWVKESEESAMDKAVTLVQLFVKAGYKKIHLDTSMKLADDALDQPLADQVIARRGVRLYLACEEAYQQLRKENPEEQRPAYIIGSEVPIPGGAQEEEESLTVTSPEAATRTIQIYQEEFTKAGLEDAFSNIIGLVVQPGVEFADADIFHYDRVAASELCTSMKQYPSMVLEGHSTDYQSPLHLKEMVEDGIAILKVGPALTFALREALFSLSAIEQELLPQEKRANFIEVLEQEMLANPGNWEKYYHGTTEELAIKRKYSFSDRCRYYFAQKPVEDAIEKLFGNLDSVNIPMSMLYQYMPLQYARVRDGKLKLKAADLAKDKVVDLVEDYNYAVKYHYTTATACI
ncbi:MAG: class II D-tagatose-bisphosphate aldolase non-catalytic subunit [Lachnospiraceae bacterium]